MLSLTAYAQTELIVKKSLFLAEAFPIEKAEDAKKILKEQRVKHKGARHVVSAFIVGNKGEVQGSSDDGEPKGTAGRPTLAVLQHKNTTNIMLTTTRWFGGILLGRGGLVRAYTESAQNVVQLATFEERKSKSSFKLKCAYSESNIVSFLLEQNNASIINIEYGEEVVFCFSILETDEDALILLMKERMQNISIEKTHSLS